MDKIDKKKKKEIVTIERAFLFKSFLVSFLIVLLKFVSEMSEIF